MKTLMYITVIVSFIFLIISGCKDDSTSTTGPTQQEEVNKITFNGGGYSNLSVIPSSTFAGYLSSIGMTSVQFTCLVNSDTLLLITYFPGQTTGTFSWSTANTYAILFLIPSGNEYRNTANSGTTNVTTYGSTGQNIEGDFNGNVVRTAAPHDTVRISCPKFSVKRTMN